MMRGNKKILVLGLAMLFAASALGSVILLDFRAEPGFNQVTLKWRVRAEQNIQAYEVQRSTKRDAGFMKVGLVEAEGSPSLDAIREYSYVDKSVFKLTDRTYYYRLRILEMNGTHSFSPVVSATPHISGARHTWGSIKAMFR